MSNISWLEIVEEAFGAPNIELSLNEIYKRVHHLIDTKYDCKKNVIAVNSVVRGTIETNSSDSDCWNQKNDRFTSTRGKGKGYWMMKNE